MREWGCVGAGITGSTYGQPGMQQNGGVTMVKAQTPAELFAKYPWLRWVVTLTTLVGQAVTVVIESFLGVIVCFFFLLPIIPLKLHLSPIVSWSAILTGLGGIAMLNGLFSELGRIRKVHGRHLKSEIVN